MRFISTLLFLTIIKSGIGQPLKSLSSDQKYFYEKLVNAFREHSLDKSKIDWTEFERRVLEKALISKDSAIILALDLNNNPHTYYKTKGRILYSSKLNKKNRVEPINDCFEINFQKDFHDIGYIEIPAFQTDLNNIKDQKKKAENYINQIIDSIRERDNNNLKGWIIDLRKNSGGNMWPMLIALTPFYPDGTLGYFIGEKEEVSWSKINDQIFYDTLSQTKKYISSPINYELINKNLKIAVLVGNKTSSSGEAVAISTKAIANAKLFGSKTSGFATANRTIKITDGEFLILTEAVDADINKIEYRDGIMPDFSFNCAELSGGLMKWFTE